MDQKEYALSHKWNPITPEVPYKMDEGVIYELLSCDYSTHLIVGRKEEANPEVRYGYIGYRVFQKSGNN